MRSEAANLGFSSAETTFRENCKSLSSRQAIAVLSNTDCGNAYPGLVPGKFKEFFAWMEAKSKTKEFSTLLLVHLPVLLCIPPLAAAVRDGKAPKPAQTGSDKPHRWQYLVRACPSSCHHTESPLLHCSSAHWAAARMMIKAVWRLCFRALCF